jgi:hypothetical protein
MNPVETIERLIKLGTLVSTTAGEAKAKDGKLDWSKFLESDAFKSISGAVHGLVGGLHQSDIEHTIARLGAKQAALLGSGKVEDLPVDKLIQYAQLSDAKLILRAKNVALAANPPFLAWLVDDVLPVLQKVAPVVIPLIL